MLAPSPLELFCRNEFLPTDLVEVRPAQRQEVLRYLETLKIMDFLKLKNHFRVCCFQFKQISKTALAKESKKLKQELTFWFQIRYVSSQNSKGHLFITVLYAIQFNDFFKERFHYSNNNLT